MEFDDDGFLWLGGIDNDIRDIIHGDQSLALQRFDGTTFHSVPLPKHENRITRVEYLYKRDDGKFYIRASSTRQIFFLFDPISLEFQEIPIGDTHERVVGISNIFNYQGKEYILKQQGDEITLCILTESATLEPVFSYRQEDHIFLIDGSTKFIPFENYCIIGDDNFPLTYLDWSGAILKSVSEDSFSKDRGVSVEKFWIDEIFRNENETFAIIERYPQLHRIDVESMEILPVEGKKYKVDEENINVFTDPNGNYWIVIIDSQGVLRFKKLDDLGLVTAYSKQITDGTIGFELVSENNNRDIWIGTNDNSLHHIRFPEEKVGNYLQGYAIRAINKFGDNKVLVATDTNGWFTIDNDLGEEKAFTLLDSSGVFAPISSRRIIPDGDLLWSNSYSNIISVEKNSGMTKFFKHYPVNCLEKLNDSTLIYGTNGYKLMAFDTRKFEHYPLAITDSLQFNDIVLARGEGIVLGATDKGLLHYDMRNGDVQMFGKNEGLTDPFLLSAEYHPVYGYLFGTRAGKIFRFDVESNELKLFYEDRLQAGIASILFEDDTWWINTFNGIVAFDPLTGNRVRFSENDGLSNNETNRYSALSVEDGIWVGTIDGLNFFKPNEMQPERSSGELVLLKARKFSEEEQKVVDEMDRSILGSQSKIVLPAEFKELEIDYSITDNLYGYPHSYRYRLNDAEWTSLGEQKRLRFPNFAPGKYTLEIEALDFSGAKIGDSIKIQILSKDFFYKTWWFYLVVLLSGFALFLYLLKQAKLRSSLQEKFSEDLLQSQEKERTRIAKELHDSVGQQLTLIKKKAQSEKQHEISALTHNTLEEVRLISRGLYPAVLKQLGLTESIRQLVYELDEETSLFFSLEIDTIDDLFNEGQALNFYRFFQECFSNILKHSEATSVEVSIHRNENRIIAEVVDNGKGFSVTDAVNQKSLGLKTLSERIRILGGTIKIVSNPEEGTRITTEIRGK
jgi:signal transduction histidine kinase